MRALGGKRQKNLHDTSRRVCDFWDLKGFLAPFLHTHRPCFTFSDEGAMLKAPWWPGDFSSSCFVFDCRGNILGSY